MSERQSEMRKKLLIFFILLFIPIGLFSIGYIKSVYLKNAYVETCYKDNAKAFDEIAAFFKQSFTESTSMIQYNQEEHILERYFEGSSTYSDCSDEDIDTLLSRLRDEYQPDSEYKVFSFVRAVFDDSGNMLLHLVVKSEENTNDEIRNYYLVYADEEYNGHSSGLAIDFSEITEEPFHENWYYWSEDVQLG